MALEPVFILLLYATKAHPNAASAAVWAGQSASDQGSIALQDRNCYLHFAFACLMEIISFI